MRKSHRAGLLAYVFGLFLIQFATVSHCIAAEVAESVKPVDPVAQTPKEGALPHALLSLNSETGAFSNYAFLVDKKARTLTVWQNSDNALKLIGAWPTDIGERDGDKRVEGDKRTPEGVYFFQTTMDGRKVSFTEYGVRIFTLDYPNYFDRLEKKTGTGIWFHAIPDTKSLVRGSRGCVVVRNQVIEELGQYIELKRTPMVIVNQVDYLAVDQWRKLREELKAWVESWRQAWSGKDIEVYMSHYSDRFIGNNMTKAQWRKYKENLNARYSNIEVNLKDIQVFNQGPKIVVRFVQSYKSSGKEDYGAKILYALKENDRFQIIGETWQPMRVGPTTASAQAGDAQ